MHTRSFHQYVFAAVLSIAMLTSAHACSPTEPPASAGANLPRRLSMGQIRKGVYRIIGIARRCFLRYRVPGKFQIRVIIDGHTGRPESVTQAVPPPHEPTARCMERAFALGRFPRFRQRRQGFTFPLILRTR